MSVDVLQIATYMILSAIALALIVMGTFLYVLITRKTEVQPLGYALGVFLGVGAVQIFVQRSLRPLLLAAMVGGIFGIGIALGGWLGRWALSRRK